jgi:hypothetical protein
MKAYGNHKANSYWMAGAPPGLKTPTEQSSSEVIEEFIRDKVRALCD